jgi:threonine/homoserine efflux transporter RhtA
LALLPVCAAIFGFVFLDQTPTLIDLLGMTFVLVGVAVQERDVIDRHPEVVETT